MSGASKDILQTINSAAIEAWQSEQPVELRFGKVLSTSPLKIKISDTVTLTKEFIILNGTVSTGDTVSVFRKQGGQQYLVLGNRTERITGTVTSVIGGSSNDSSDNTSSALSTKRNALVSVAKSKLGSRYVYGATGPNSFDCSGFTYWCYKQIGITIPRTAASQYASSTKISKSSMLPGDLCFFSGTTSAHGITHVGMYIGNNTLIHAANPSSGVCTASLTSSYYTSHWAGAGRYIKD